jgi:hypothetical protein
VATCVAHDSDLFSVSGGTNLRDWLCQAIWLYIVGCIYNVEAVDIKRVYTIFESQMYSAHMCTRTCDAAFLMIGQMPVTIDGTKETLSLYLCVTCKVTSAATKSVYSE